MKALQELLANDPHEPVVQEVKIEREGRREEREERDKWRSIKPEGEP